MSFFDSLNEVVKSFSFQTSMRSNIVSGPSMGGSMGSRSFTGGQKSATNNMGSDLYLSTYYRKFRELMDYEISELTQTSIQIYRDYMVGYFNKSGELIEVDQSIPDYKIHQSRLNKIFKDLDIVREVKDNLWGIIYRGSYCFKVAYDKEARKYVKFYLQNPHNVITLRKNKDISGHLVVSRDGSIFQVSPESIFRIGKADLSLINDLNPEFFDDSKEDTLIKSDYMTAGCPLYYFISGKIKEFLLKEQLLSLLSIKDLIQPLLLLVRLDKNTSVSEGNQLALNIENMINKYSDISHLVTSNYDINGLMDSLMNNIRVLPDFQSSMGDMGSVDLSKIAQKISEIENTQELKKENILTAMSIPRSLFNGESTKWDAIKSSQRLMSKVNSIVVSITDSLRSEAVRFYREMTGKDIDPEMIKIHLFSETDVDYNNFITNTDIVSQLTDGVGRILDATMRTMSDIPIIDPAKYASYVHRKLQNVDKDIDSFFTEELILKHVKSLKGGGEPPPDEMMR